MSNSILARVTLAIACTAPLPLAQCDLSPATDALPSRPTFVIPDDFPEIQDAVFLFLTTPATVPVSIMVRDGTYAPIYFEPWWFPQGITLYSENGAATTIIDGDSQPGPAQVAINIDGFVPSPVGTSQGPVNIGLRSPQGTLHGFTIRDGVADLLLLAASLDYRTGGGLRVRNLEPRIRIVGNLITDNAAATAGGGIVLDNCLDAVVALNEIANNSVGIPTSTGVPGYQFSPPRGAGLYQNVGNLLLLENHIHDNGFEDVFFAWFNVEPPRQGGGVAANLSPGGFPGTPNSVATLNACGNLIEDNQASEGNGVWIRQATLGFPMTSTAEFSSNEIRNNSSWSPSAWYVGTLMGAGFNGGGFHLEAPDDPFRLSNNTTSLERNLIHDNVVQEPQLAGFGYDAAVTVTEAGGGVHYDFGTQGVGNHSLAGNAIYANSAVTRGGGVHFGLADDPMQNPNAQLLFLNNTVAFNSLQAGGLGGGVYVTQGANLRGVNQILFQNVAPASVDDDWFAEPGVAPFEFSQMPVPQAGTTSVDLFGTQCDNAQPTFPTPGDFRVLPFTPLFDTGLVVLDPANPSAPFPLSEDIDGGNRIRVCGVDRGTQEFIGFRRGDANADGSIDMGDAIKILDELFDTSPTEFDSFVSADTNDDGTVNIADAIFLLAYLYPPDPNNIVPPPSPFVACGVDDLTPDDLDCGVGTPCVCP